MNWKETIDQINKERDEKIRAAALQYLEDHSKYNEGEVFTDHIGSIKIIRKKVELSFLRQEAIPSIIYYGIELRKDLQPKKNGSHRWAYLSIEEK